MPEGPEIRIASMFINQVASTHTFGGKVLKGEKATKLADVPFEATEYTLNAESRGKELKVTYSTRSSRRYVLDHRCYNFIHAFIGYSFYQPP